MDEGTRSSWPLAQSVAAAAKRFYEWALNLGRTIARRGRRHSIPDFGGRQVIAAVVVYRCEYFATGNGHAVPELAVDT